MDRDFAVTALRVVEQAIGEKMDGSRLKTPTPGRIQQQSHSAS